MQYLVVVEIAPTSYGAYVPDLPGCVAVGETRDEVVRLIREAIEFHIEGMLKDGLPIPLPTTTARLLKWNPHDRNGPSVLIPSLEGRAQSASIPHL